MMSHRGPQIAQSVVQTRCSNWSVGATMSYSDFVVICALSIACVGRCLTPPASSKVDVAFQGHQGSGLALIYG